MTLPQLLNGSTVIVTAIGILAFLVSLVVEVTKDFIPKRIPTKLYTLLVSVVATLASVFSALQYGEMDIKVYHVIGGIVLSFVVTFVSTYGWEQLKELKDRFIR